MSNTLKVIIRLTGQQFKRRLLIFTLHKVVEDQEVMFHINGQREDTHFFSHLEITNNLKSKLVFTLKSLVLEDFQHKLVLPILEQLMDPLIKILDHFKLSGDR